VGLQSTANAVFNVVDLDILDWNGLTIFACSLRPPFFIFQNAKRPSFDKPSDAKRKDRERFKEEDWMKCL
jgi:hypothetical protein